MTKRNNIEVGSIVVLKSGGPEMTVTDVPRTTDDSVVIRSTYTCQWFAGKKLEKGFFSEGTIELVTSK